MAAGNAQPTNGQIVRVGHTYSGLFGSEPQAKTRGRDGKATDQVFSGSGGQGTNP